METAKIAALLAAAELGSISKAAENLGYTQSGVTHIVNSLEEEAGFPLLMRGNSKMPLGIVLMGMLFNTLNALMQGGWIFYVSPAGYYDDWFSRPYIWIGGIVFLAGMAINLHSDYIIRHLRKPGDTRHYIPRGGLFRYVTSANYFGELLEWVGFAIASWSWAGAVFAWWTFANLAPRAASLRRRYTEEFGEEFTRLGRKRIIPFIY